MLTCKCIIKFRNPNYGTIKDYVLQAPNGDIRKFTSDEVKQAIREGKLNVTNLTLTKDNRLVDSKRIQRSVDDSKEALLTRKIVEQINSSKKLLFMSNKPINKLDNKARLLGYKVTNISEEFILIEKQDSSVLVSNKQIILDNAHIEYKPITHIIKTEAKDTLVGLFEETDFTSIDFHNVGTSKVTDMSNMFRECKAKSLDLSSFDTSNVIVMASMFLFV